MSGHTYCFKTQTKKSTSWEVLKFDDCEIVLVENCPCVNKDELLAKERYYITNFKCVNKNINIGFDKKNRTINYNKENKEKIKERQKKWYEDNKERLLEKAKEYRKKYDK
jgi:hypothetical protein